MGKRMTHEEIEEASRIASEIIARHRPKQRRITVTQDDKDAFSMIWGMYVNADEASDGTWISDEDRKKITKLHNKIYGRR
ncbi:hypothetical protein [Paenibacillus sp. DMB5]|uniref:hypothetical protein n=1 Tax=Paenibacillus sp. DMB5 TaxID=1780103 RepID=UPI000FE146C2|nr:hypothetical protein [Paenibacillus sp. DMB5]